MHPLPGNRDADFPGPRKSARGAARQLHGLSRIPRPVADDRRRYPGGQQLDGVTAMQTQTSQSVLKLLPSFADFAFLAPAAFLFGRMAGLKTLLGDCDTGWHIRTGEWILAHRGVPS